MAACDSMWGTAHGPSKRRNRSGDLVGEAQLDHGKRTGEWTLVVGGKRMVLEY